MPVSEDRKGVGEKINLTADQVGNQGSQAMKVVSLLLQNQRNLPASLSLSPKAKRLRNTQVRAEANGHYLPKNGQAHAMCEIILYSEKTPICSIQTYTLRC